MTKYWIAWALASFLSFIVPEVWALLHNSRDTLSETIWRATNSSLAHYVFGIVLTGVLSWVVAHLVFHVR